MANHLRTKGAWNVCAAGLLLAIPAGAGRAGDDTEELRQLIERQSRQLQEQAKAVEAQHRQLQEQTKILEQQSLQIERLNSVLNQSENANGTPPVGDAAVKKIVVDYLEDRDRKAKEKKSAEDRQKAEKAKAEADEPKEVGKDLVLKTSWNNGFRAETADKAFRVHFGGLIDFDAGWYSVPDAVQNALAPPGLREGSDLRRARFTADGTSWELMDWKLDIDFSRASDVRKTRDAPETNVTFLDVWVGLHDVPYLGTVRVGHQKETLSFIGATGASSLPFMERPMPFDAIEDDFNRGNGITISRTYCDKLLYSWLGLFQTNTRAEAFAIDRTAKLALDGRFCITPVYGEDQQQWLNVGVAGSIRANPSLPDAKFGFILPFDRTTVVPLVRTGSSFQVPNLIDTGNYFSNDGTQAFCVCYNQACGPLTVGASYEGQYTAQAFSGGLPRPDNTLPPKVVALGNIYFDGYCLEILCFLTRGDHHPFDPNNQSYGRVRPVENFYVFRDPCTGACGHGLGAWEIGLRYDHVNVKNGALLAMQDGGELDSFTLGLNWYWNPNAKVMLNYVYTTGLLGNNALVDGAIHSLGMRVHYDF